MRHGLINIWMCAKESLDRRDQEKKVIQRSRNMGSMQRNFLNKEKQKYKERLEKTKGLF